MWSIEFFRRRITDWLRTIPMNLASLTELPQRIRELVKGACLSLMFTFPFYAVWLAFTKKELFAFSYIREVALLSVWVMCVLYVLPLKSIKVGKDSLELSFADPQIPPSKAIQPQKRANQ